MEYIKKEELIEGEIYNATTNDDRSEYVFKLTKNSYDCININKKYNNTLYREGNFSSNIFKFSKTTSEEKHWLNTCIEQDKFITFEEHMKTFVPEYVECIKQLIGSAYKLGIIYKVNHNGFINNGSHSFAHYKYNQDRFKPSTKEAYDAQFVVKEPEFVLPENWHIIVQDRNKEIKYYKKYFTNHNWEFINRFIYGLKNGIQINAEKCGTEITFDQFKKYVLKEEIVEEIKVIEPLPQFKVIETIETITKVENNEGNQFFINDKIITKLGSRPLIIKSFKYFEDNMVVITNNNELDINDIEHYIEPKVEVKDEFILPEKWCILVTPESRPYIKKYRESIYYKPYEIGNYAYQNNLCGDMEAKDNLQLTLDQFKKYVLKEEDKEETLLEKAKRLYPVGIKFKCLVTGKDYIIPENITFRVDNDNNNKVYSYVNNTIFHHHYNGEIWADIINY